MLLETEKPTAAVLKDEEVLTLSLETPSVFKILLDRYETAFLRKAREIVGAREEANDIVVETFTKIYLRGKQFKKVEGASFKSWAYKILLNTSISYYRRLKRESMNMSDVDYETVEFMHWEAAKLGISDDAHHWFAKKDLQDFVASILVRIPENLARPLKLYFLGGYSHDEIAKKESLTRGAVKTRIHRAKKLLKVYLKELS